MKKKIFLLFLAGMCTSVLFGGCSNKKVTDSVTEQSVSDESNTKTDYRYLLEDAVNITLSDDKITADGDEVSEDTSNPVYVKNDIIYYEAGHDFTYGAGSESDEHSQEEADAHTVVHITQAGTYRVSGTLSSGQIAIDLGEDAKEDPEAVVNLILDNANITCSVAPAVIFYNVYECSSDDEETATKEVDTSAAGANVYLAENSVNHIDGSYVARIYKSYELSEDGTEVVDNKKLHKYDGAFYSKMSMNINAIYEGTGILNITADNEGLDSELHLTINGGNINIQAGNDGINTNEDNVSVTTINDGVLNIIVTGETGEGDGIDSNGWIVINGGTVTAAACSTSGDAGIDSDMGIYINGGTVAATGNMYDHIESENQTFIVFQFNQRQKGGKTYTLKKGEEIVAECTPVNDFSYFVLSSPELEESTYTLWQGDTQLSGTTSTSVGGMMMGGGQPPENMEIPEDMELPEGMEMPENGQPPEKPDDMELPEGMEQPEDGQRPELPEGAEIPEGMEKPEDGQPPEKPEGSEGSEAPENGEAPERPEGNKKPDESADSETTESSTDFTLEKGSNFFTNISENDI